MSSTTTIDSSAADAFAFSQLQGNDYEEVSTIFVIGFPEDIQEREFRNMFTFAPGFESSALKYPSGFESEDMFKKAVIGFAKFRSRNEANYARDFLNGRQVDADCRCITAEIAKRNLHFKRTTTSDPGISSVNGVLTPAEFILQYTLQPPPLFVGGLSSKSTSPALLETNQMKSSSSSLDSSFLDYGSLNSPVPWDILDDNPSAVKPTTGFKAITSKSSLCIDTSSLRIDTDVPALLHIGSSDNTEKSVTTCRNSPTGLDNEPVEILTGDPCSSIGGSFISSSSGSFTAYDAQPSGEDGSVNASFVNRFAAKMNSVGSERGFSSALFSSDSLWASSTTSTTNTVVTSGTSRKMNTGNGMMHHPNGNVMMNAMYTNPMGGMFQQQPLAYVNGTSGNSCNSMSMNGNGGGSAFNVSLPTPASIAAAGYRCPADQNPPCNTLYVGNLPTNTCEAELRELFSRCLGYRRMSFRMRVNGPMVFVEFDSIPYAQQALNDLHGTLLSNSIKGGIRLSFSKNPLGVRPMGSLQMGGYNGWGLPVSGQLSPMSGFFGGEMTV
ncbi:UNVERIFIED_CONTAM: hypothetical protein HDU68_004975 [Siphonaria sp. JEL0065]|nr:hypothetical protein HDU68_004975 [Siphonaria sp. JEL0065]